MEITQRRRVLIFFLFVLWRITLVYQSADPSKALAMRWMSLLLMYLGDRSVLERGSFRLELFVP